MADSSLVSLVITADEKAKLLDLLREHQLLKSKYEYSEAPFHGSDAAYRAAKILTRGPA